MSQHQHPPISGEHIQAGTKAHLLSELNLLRNNYSSHSGYTEDFRPRFTRSDASKIHLIAAMFDVKPNVLIRILVIAAVEMLTANMTQSPISNDQKLRHLTPQFFLQNSRRNID